MSRLLPSYATVTRALVGRFDLLRDRRALVGFLDPGRREEQGFQDNERVISAEEMAAMAMPGANRTH